MVDQHHDCDACERTVDASFGRVAAAWRRMDRGWRAVVLGLAIVAVHLLGQTI